MQTVDFTGNRILSLTTLRPLLSLEMLYHVTLLHNFVTSALNFMYIVS